MTGREPQRSCEPSDRREQPRQEKMNKTAALGRDSAAPSSPASAANRMTTTESLFAKGINDFCNKICQEPTFGLPRYSIILSAWTRIRSGIGMPKVEAVY